VGCHAWSTGTRRDRVFADKPLQALDHVHVGRFPGMTGIFQTQRCTSKRFVLLLCIWAAGHYRGWCSSHWLNSISTRLSRSCGRGSTKEASAQSFHYDYPRGKRGLRSPWLQRELPPIRPRSRLQERRIVCDADRDGDHIASMLMVLSANLVNARSVAFSSASVSRRSLATAVSFSSLAYEMTVPYPAIS
jgi:hypothetical protein